MDATSHYFGELFDDLEAGTAISSSFASVEELLPQDRTVVEAAVEKRQREFAKTRLGAHQLLAKYGIHIDTHC